jgi:hypothetical protein
LRFAICDCGVATLMTLFCVSLASCASRASQMPAAPPRDGTPQRATTTHPILYHRTGGIAGTDDRVVIWPDGIVEVDGKVMTDARARVPADRLERLVSILDRWEQLDDAYPTGGVADAYLIRIDYGGKSVEASDLAPNLPRQFREAFTEIESIAAQAAGAEARPAPVEGAP